jgi:dipeptidyl aminopeptidase/acylaminoacyl peptidase
MIAMRVGARYMLALSLALMSLAATATDVDVRDFFRHSEVNDIELSPTGEFLAVTVPQDDRTLLAVLRTRDKGIVAKWDYGADMHVVAVDWVNPERFLVRVAEKTGSFDYMVGEPNLYAANADGSGRMTVEYGGTYELVDTLPKDDRYVLLQRTVERPNLFKMDVNSGRMTKVAVSPVESGGFAIDVDGRVRYAIGENKKLKLETWRRDGEEWTKLAEVDAMSGDAQVPVGFAPDDRIYMRASRSGKPDRLLLLDPNSGEEQELFANPVVDAGRLIWSHDARRLLGVSYEPDFPRKKYFDGEDEETALLASLDLAFEDFAVDITSTTRDGNLLLARVYSDVDPGRFFLYDRKASKATYLLSSRPWIDPAQMAEMKPIALKARDGRELRGYLTLPPGVEGKALPLIVNPHGGPHGVRDDWGFNPEVQYFANRGYAVLQVNYRGSGGYGREFLSSGYKRWGTAMQDDLTDSVRWAIAQGIADPARVCIYGASYGGYAALMSVVREPDLYRCSIGYVGVYSLPLMKRKGDIPESEFGRAFLARVLPDTEAEMQAQSPAYHVDRITVPLMLVQGRKDRRVPIAQMEFLIDRLEDAGKAPELVVIEDKEGHGFYDLDNNAELYPKMLAFFEKYIGKGATAPASH